MTDPALREQPRRVQLSRRKGWRMPENTVSVARPRMLGNPFPVDIYGRDGAVDRFRRWLTGNMSALEMSQSSRCDRWSNGPGPGVSLVTVRTWVRLSMVQARGKNLACWCALDAKCHADVLLELANPHLPAGIEGRETKEAGNG